MYDPENAHDPHDPHRTERDQHPSRPSLPPSRLLMPPVARRQPRSMRDVERDERRNASTHLGLTHVTLPRFYLSRVVYQVMAYLPIQAGTTITRREREPIALASSTSLEAVKNAAYWYTYYTHRTTWLRREKRILGGIVIGHDDTNCIGYVYSSADGGPRQVVISRSLVDLVAKSHSTQPF